MAQWMLAAAQERPKCEWGSIRWAEFCSASNFHLKVPGIGWIYCCQIPTCDHWSAGWERPALLVEHLYSRRSLDRLVLDTPFHSKICSNKPGDCFALG